MTAKDCLEFFEKAYQLRDAGDLVGARDEFERIISSGNCVLEAQLELADIFLREEKIEAAENILKDCIGDPSASSRAYFELAKIYKEKEEYASAVDLLKTALRKDPDFYHAALELAFVYEKSYPASDAIDPIKKLSKNFPDSKEFTFLLAKAYERAGDYKSAEKILKSLLLAEISDPRILRELARISKTIKDYSASEKYYRKLICLEPENGKNHAELASVYSDGHENEKALKELLTAMEKGEKSFSIFRDIYQNYLSMGDYSKAEEKIKSFLFLYPDLKFLHAILGRLYYDRGDFSKFRQELKNIIKYSVENYAEELSGKIELKTDKSKDEKTEASPPFRPFFTWNITYDCNYNCSYCSVIHSEKVRWERTRYLSPEEWEEIWKKIYLRNGPCHLNITGGEPFVYPKFLEILRRILKYHTVGLQTNLSWDPEEFLAQIPLERVNICSSFHPEKVRLEDFIGSVKKLKDAGADISVNYVAFPPQLKELEKLVSEFSLNGIMLTILPYTGQYEGRYYPKEYSKDERKLLKDIIKNYSLTDRHLLWWLKQDDDELFTGFSEARRPDQTEKFKSKEELPSPISKSSNTELHSFEEEYINNSEKFLDSRLCRMGEVYAIINPDGRAVRCCADLRGLGNIIDGSFNFSSQPLPCEDVTCRCFKAMILGSEDEWGLSWIATESERETDYLRLLNMPVEEYGEK